MTAYENFVSDFPMRCLEVLKIAEKQARLEQREVTLILMVASAGLVIPYERLSDKKDHPTGDPKKYEKAAEKLDSLLKQKFLSSSLSKGTGKWKAGRLKSIAGDPDSWDELDPGKNLSSDRKVRSVIDTIRNALAHGNIFTYQNPIERIIFVSKKKKKENRFSFVSVSPEDFSSFIKSWFEFLKEANIPFEVSDFSFSNAA